MCLGLSINMHFHVSESWKCMRNECCLKDISLYPPQKYCVLFGSKLSNKSNVGR